MSNLTAKFAPILLAGVAASAVVVALPVRAVRAADTCLTEPKGDAPHGKHWHYRIERGTGHHCWYLRGEDEKAADAPSAAPTEKVASQQPDASASRSFAEAHDEVAPRTSTANRTSTNNASPAPAAPSVWPTAAAAAPAAPSDAAATTPAATPDASPSPVASRWPQTSDTAPADATPVAAAPATTSPQGDPSMVVADAAPTTAAEPPSAPPPPADLAAPPVERQTGSLRTLLLVAFGALALAGFTGSAVYRLGRRSKRNNWLRERNAWQDAQNPHRPPWVDEPRIQPELAAADLDQPHFDEQHVDEQHLDEQHLDQPQEIEPQSGFSLAADETSLEETPPGSEHIEKIEEFLARLTQQLHDELEGTRPRSA